MINHTTIILSLIAISLLLVSGSADPITWNKGSDQGAGNSVTDGFITLYSTKSPKGAQFLYKKNLSPKDPPPGLANVLLVNRGTGSTYTLQTDFDMINQACSCYWLDASELESRFSTLKSSNDYVIRFQVSGRGNFDSGSLGLQLSIPDDEVGPKSVNQQDGSSTQNRPSEKVGGGVKATSDSTTEGDGWRWENNGIFHFQENEYEGELEDGLSHGQGRASFRSGSQYVGSFNKGQMHGHGFFDWSNGVTYEGDFIDNKVAGQGTFIWRESGFVYHGQVADGLRHGYGVFKKEMAGSSTNDLPQGLYYEGQWANGERHGKGKLVFSGNEDQGFYDGDWQNDQKNGTGILQYPSGNVYEGEFKNDMRHGQGTMQWKDRQEVYSGEWKDNQPHGYGEYVWYKNSNRFDQYPFNNTYHGEWKHGKRHGYGSFLYASGARYVGHWEEDVKHGYGIYLLENGRRYEGEFRNDQMVGQPLEDFNPERPFMFKDIPATLMFQESPLDVQKSLNAVVLRHITFLRKLYNRFAGPSGTLLTSKAMTRQKLWKMFKTFKVYDRGFQLVNLNRAMAIPFQNDKMFYHRYEEPHNASETIIFQEFLQCLISVSMLVRRNLAESRDEIEFGVAKAFNTLIKEKFIPNFNENQLANGIEDIKDYLSIEQNASIKSQFDEMFHAKAKRHEKALIDSPGDKTFTIRETINMLKDYNLIDGTSKSGKGLTAKKVIQVFSEIVKDIVTDDCYNLEFEVIADELLDGLYACAVASYKEPEPAMSAVKLNSEVSEVNVMPSNTIGNNSSSLTSVPTDSGKGDVVKKPTEDNLTTASKSSAKKARDSPTKELKEPVPPSTSSAGGAGAKEKAFKRENTRSNKDKAQSIESLIDETKYPVSTIETIAQTNPTAITNDPMVQEIPVVIPDPNGVIMQFFGKLFESYKNETGL